jgi:hypothetical protein
VQDQPLQTIEQLNNFCHVVSFPYKISSSQEVYF